MEKLIQVITIIILFTNTVFSQKNTVLFVMSSADTLELKNGKKLRQTGVFLNEFYLAYKAVSEAGYNVRFATPGGVVATIDNESVNNDYWKDKVDLKTKALNFVKTNQRFNQPLTLEKAIEKHADYIGLVIPGGQGLMVDLIHDKNIPILLKSFAKAEKVIGLICHAPSLILTIPKEENPFIGYQFNSVTPFEEFYIEKFVMKGKPKNRKIAKQLKKIGLKYKKKLPKANYAVRDRNLITSQNPFSGSSFNSLYLEALSDFLK